MEIMSIQGEMASVDLGGVKKEISLALVDDVVPGDYVIVHAGFALYKLDVEETKRTFSLMATGRTERFAKQMCS